jgi:hypothetical protein
VLFRLRCRAAQVYLMLGADPGPSKMIGMREIHDEEWETRLDLAPGTYRYRYYVDDGKHLVCFSPSDVTRGGGGVDTRLLVPAERSQDSDADEDGG